MIQESIKHFPIPLRKSPKVIAEGDFLETMSKFIDPDKMKIGYVVLVATCKFSVEKLQYKAGY